MARRRRDPEDFAGRSAQLERLRALWRRLKGASLVTCTGRRRVGKSRLIKEFGEAYADTFFEFQGLPPREDQTDADQLRHFGEKLSEYMGLDQAIPINNWTQAFALLERLLPTKGKTVVLLDEISWMGRHDKDFAGKIKDAWDTRFSGKRGLVVVLCGSVSTWIENNIIRHTGFLDRISARIELPELSISESAGLVWKKAGQVSPMEQLRMLAVTGGVPGYLEQLDPKASAEENIRSLCFQPEGGLFRKGGRIDEFDAIFNDVFARRADIYRRIAASLATGSKTISELSDALGKTRAGYLTHYLRDMEIAGFVKEEPHFTVGEGEGKISHFRLGDNYLRFYLRYLEPKKKQIAGGRFKWNGLEKLPAWNTLLGFQFENLVLNNAEIVERLLGIEGKVIRSGPFYQPATQRRKGCQFDLLFETGHSLYCCEMKLRRETPKKVVGEMQEKQRRLFLPRKHKHLNRFPVLIYAGELDPAIAGAGYFHTIIDFGQLLKTK
jgi:AAA+ ATPase superfamily predicted ATPase